MRRLSRPHVRIADPAIALLRDLVAIDSVNPSLVPGARGEAEIARRIADECERSVFASRSTDVAPGRPNVVGVLDGRAPGRSLMFCGHIDTVGVAGMERPFEPEIRDGRLYGRGAQDMKGGVAAMIGAARRIAESGGLDAGRADRGRGRGRRAREHRRGGAGRAWRADAAVVTEPTDLDVAVAHKGFQWVAVETRGRAAHGSRPLDGRDAILRMGRVLARLEALDRRLQTGRAHAAARHGVAARVDHRWRPRVEQLSGSLRAADRAADAPGRAPDVGARGGERDPRPAAREDAEFEARRAGSCSAATPYEIDADASAARRC